MKTKAFLRSSLALEELGFARAQAQEANKQVDDLKKALEAKQEESRKMAQDSEALKKRHSEEIIHAVRNYKRSEGFRRDLKAYADEHLETMVTTWLATGPGQARLAEEGVFSYNLGYYTAQRDVYEVLR
ncbi:PREDICTED: uncharacterized protein LOC109176611 [Ipomoea nil]|uniref:uncharacterized protein LOC109176611 n=1 Tax=Ipomoea nil TaxID=35883 RepID=UPI0009012813|nr:PREDICTED: uncharacterized protein LOC109176611 [Ipomoea nil]